MQIIHGIDDVPAIADNKCGRCKIELNSGNFSDWYIFMRENGQMYKVPCCDKCSEEDNVEREKEE